MAKRTHTAPSARPSAVRCAIYTRKSTDEGLDQEFNSLDAQHEACTAYITSQRHEGWNQVRTRYDDGGFSGGTMERPALRQLLADIAAGKIDIIVLYKVDRLTRSLSDFARIVEVLDAAGASFVSVTQPINTTTSMGRLMLNVLLSFAQFEREMTGERIRDKIAASKAKGMWMGGTPPLGYEVRDRKLVVNEAEAETVRHIFRRYVALGSGRALADELMREGYRTKVHHQRGGVPYHRGMLFYLLSNQTYIGKVVHKGLIHDGEHAGILPLDLWEAAQTLLEANRNGEQQVSCEHDRSLLAGKLFDGAGRAMTPTHTTKGTRRYRYYVTHHRELGPDLPPAWRIPARELEQLVVGRITTMLTDRTVLLGLSAAQDAKELAALLEAGSRTAEAMTQGKASGACVEAFVRRLRLEADHVVIEVDVERLLDRLVGKTGGGDDHCITLVAPVTRVRQGKDVRLMVLASDDGSARNEPLIALLAEARDAYAALLAAPEKTAALLAQESGRCRHRIAKLLRIAQLAPEIVSRCLHGTQPTAFTTATLFSADIPLRWDDQQRQFGFA